MRPSPPVSTQGLLVTSAGRATLRLSPPLTVTADEVEQAIAILQEVLS